MRQDKELDIIEAEFTVLLDDWYLKKKEQLKGGSPHWLGSRKERVKTILDIHLNELDRYVSSLEEGRKEDDYIPRPSR